ncbi:MAG: DUF1573 domain-containing protein [Phycisphaerales bacterium]|nr:DUF1573 domain-containing protein [Phycisphaerales bacterium]
MIHWLLATSLLSQAVGSSPPASDALAAIAEQLAGSERESASLQTHFTATVFEPAKGEQINQSAMTLESREVRMIQRQPVMAMHYDYREGEAQPIGVDALWNGVRCIQSLGAKGAHAISRRPSWSTEFDCLPYFNVSEGEAFAGQRPLSELLRTYTLTSLEEHGDEVLVTLEVPGDSNEVVEVFLERKPELRLKRLVKTLLGPRIADQPRRKRLALAFWIEEWADYHGVRLPRVGHRDIVLWDHDPKNEAEEPQCARVTYAHASAAILGADAPIDSGVRIVHGDYVKDDRLGIAYRVGDLTAHVDGYEVPLNAPAPADLSDRLHEFVPSPGVTPTPKREGPSSSTSSSKETRPRNWWQVALVGIGAGVLAAFILRVTPRSIVNTRAKTRVLAFAALAVIGVITVIIFLRSGDAADGSLLAGSKSHDFGAVLVGNGTVKLKHTFKLVNVSGEQLEIVRAVPTCGCTFVEELPSVVESGEAIDVPVVLELSTPRHRDVQVHLVFKNHESLALRLSATGRRTMSVMSAQDSVLLKPSEAKELLIVAVSQDMPKALLLQAPDSIKATFDG